MSRSRKKTPIRGMTLADSEKQDKRLANRKIRRVNKIRVTGDQEPAHVRELSDPWGMDKDGRQYFGDEPAEDVKKQMRK